LWEIHQIYDFNAVGDEDEAVIIILRSAGQRSSSRVTTCHMGSIISPVSGEQAHTLMRLIVITPCQKHMTVKTFSRSWGQRSRSQITFTENALCRRRQTDRRFAVEDHL